MMIWWVVWMMFPFSSFRWWWSPLTSIFFRLKPATRLVKWMSLDIDMSFAGYWYDWLGIENENRFGLNHGSLGPPTIEGVSLRWSNQHLSDEPAGNEPPWLENPPDIYGWFSQPWMLIYRKFSDMFPMIFVDFLIEMAMIQNSRPGIRFQVKVPARRSWVAVVLFKSKSTLHESHRFP